MKEAIIGAGKTVFSKLYSKGNYTSIIDTKVSNYNISQLAEEIIEINVHQEIKIPWVDPYEPVFNHKKHIETCAKIEGNVKRKINKITMKLNQKIVNILKEHEGGEKFFDALDNMIREDEDIITNFRDFVFNKSFYISYPSSLFVVSGKFGRVLLNNLYFSNVLLVNGGIRSGEEVEIDVKESLLERYKEHIKTIYFLDDSFYSGKTRDKISEKLKETIGQGIDSTYVVYDGSKIQENKVFSMFKYYK